MAQKHWSNEMKAIRSQDPELADKLARLLKKEEVLRAEGNVYHERYSARQIELSFGKIVQTEAQRARVLKALRKGPLSVKKLATTLKLAPPEVLAHIVELRRRNRVALHHIEERTPLYIALFSGDSR
jgi:predicted Rossmann fold nucleotide-binding protein DprA/Smf involved in DNA uptake